MLHFVYIYIVWCVIQYAFRMMTGSVANHEMDPYAILFIAYQPITVLWFVYVLLAFFIITRLLRPVPFFIVLPLAGALAVTPVISQLLAGPLLRHLCLLPDGVLRVG